MLANTSDFDAAKDAVAIDQLLEVDRYALARAAQFQAEIVGALDEARGVYEGGHYGVYEFHPVVAKLQVYCSEDLGAFYLDVLKDRLYTTAPKSLARRSAQTALWHLTHAMLRWMAPFLSFTAEEAWTVFAPGKKSSIFVETYHAVPKAAVEHDWPRLLQLRASVLKALEDARTAGQIGSSLQAELSYRASGADFELLSSLGDDLRFVFITSKAQAVKAADGESDGPVVTPSSAAKCERCWHYRDDVGHDPAHPTICGRCTANLFGAGEARKVA
jgi:isoleucyl-tRNA synthetase